MQKRSTLSDLVTGPFPDWTPAWIVREASVAGPLDLAAIRARVELQNHEVQVRAANANKPVCVECGERPAVLETLCAPCAVAQMRGER